MIPESKSAIFNKLLSEGTMVNGDNSTQVAGYISNTSTALEMALTEISEQRKLVAKSQEQIDRLIGLLEKQ